MVRVHRVLASKAAKVEILEAAELDILLASDGGEALAQSRGGPLRKDHPTTAARAARGTRGRHYH
jgi:hypothetical protein